MAILINGEIVSVGMIKEPIGGGEISIVAIEDKQSKSLLANLYLYLTREKEIEELIKKLETKQKNIKDIIVVREIKTFMKELKPMTVFKTTIIKGDKWRTEIGEKKYRQITFYDGENIWMCSPFMKMMKMKIKIS